MMTAKVCNARASSRMLIKLLALLPIIHCAVYQLLALDAVMLCLFLREPCSSDGLVAMFSTQLHASTLVDILV